MNDVKTHRRRAQGPLLPSLPSWDDVRFFLAIHRAGSLSAAAVSLAVSQPTCGRRLTALEESLGLRLFDRTPEGLRLTSEGGALLEAATRMEESARDLAVRATSRGHLEGVVRVGTTELFACTFLVGALRVVRERHPGVRVQLVLSNDESDLLRGEVDVAFRFLPFGRRPTPQMLVAQKLGDEPFALYATDDYLRQRGAPSNPGALVGHDVVVYEGRHPAAAWCASAFRGATVVLAVSSMQVVAAAIAAGMGLGVIPSRAAALWPRLAPVSAAVARATGWLVVHPHLRTEPRVRAVVDVMADLFRGSPSAGARSPEQRHRDRKRP